MSHHQEQLEIIKNFSPVTATHYYSENDVKCYFGVILRNGCIDVKKYPSGRMNTSLLENNEHFLCFKKIVNGKKEVQLYLRQTLDENTLDNNDLDMYLYIKNNCPFQP